MPIKVSYAYCEWSDREEVRSKVEKYEQFDKVKNQTSVKEKRDDNR